MLYFTNYYIIKNSKYNYSDKINFPYLNSSYCNKPFELIQINSDKISLKNKIMNLVFKVRNLFVFNKRKSISVINFNDISFIEYLFLPINFNIQLIENQENFF